MDMKFYEDLWKRYFVYLLLSTNEKYKGRIYIGFTIDPNRRLKQHNAGVYHGGAFKTNKKGPWEMILAIHGFPHEMSALRFEWAWQKPHFSRRLKHLKNKTHSESLLNFHLRILDGMLETGPWKRLPLQVQWLKPNRMENIVHCTNIHRISFVGENLEAVRNKKTKNKSSVQKKALPDDYQEFLCYSCREDIVNLNYLKCPNPACKEAFHINCLANHILNVENEIIPFKGHCPSCYYEMTWCHLISSHRLLL